MKRRRIKGYDLEELIGTGGFGEVHRAVQPAVNRVVAIKVILPDRASQPEFINRFEIEAQLVANLEHPYIVPIYDFWRDQEGAFLVMRWLAGGSLSDALLQQGAFSPERASRMLTQVAEALHVAHQSRVIHQDIKPANIMLDGNDNFYLTDFGIARLLDRDIDLAQDENNVMHGSPTYISPEHLQRREITPQSDIYSLGILLYEVLTGDPPFAGAQMMELLKNHLKKPLPLLQEKREDLPDALNEVLQTATAKDPKERYEKVTDMAWHFDQIVRRLTDPTISGAAPSAGTARFASTGILDLSAEPVNPYKGLRAFQESDAKDFYGRTALIEKLIQKMIEKHPMRRFLGVIGPSGSGKSSVVRAGLVPGLRAGTIIGMPRLLIADMTPSGNPMRKLEGTVLRVALTADETLLKMLSRDDFDLHEVLHRALPDKSEMLLVIDQFEEAFTLVENDAVRRHFLQTLYDAVMHDDSKLRLVVTLRADFYHRPLAYPGWGDLFDQRSVTVLPMKPEEIQEAIVTPANNAGIDLDFELVTRIVGDVSQQAGALPLLQYALTELFERRDGLVMTAQAYEDMGGISGALARRAEEIFKDLPPQRQEATRLFFPRLVKLGEGTQDTRRRAQYTELTAIGDDPTLIQQTLDSFGKFRLLTFANETVRRIHDDGNSEDVRVPTVEIAHEALITSWTRLQDWMTTNRDDLRMQERLSAATAEWLNADRDDSFLVSGARLAMFTELQHSDHVALNKDENAFITASQQEADRIRKLRQGIIATIIALSLLAGVAGIFAFLQRNRAIAEAITSRSNELAAQSQTVSDRPDLSLLLSLQALQTEDNYDTRHSLLLALQRNPRLVGQFYGHEDTIRDLAKSPDDRVIVSGGRDNTVIVWEAATRTERAQLTGHTDWINALAFSPDGALIASGGQDGVVKLWDATTYEEVASITPNESQAATGIGAAGGVQQAVPIRSLAFSPDGAFLAIGDDNGQVALLDVNEREISLREDSHASEASNSLEGTYALAYSPDGQLIITGGADTRVRIWDAATLTLITTLVGHTDVVRSVLPVSDRVLVSAGEDSNIIAWDITTGEEVTRLIGHLDAIWDMALSSDGSTLLSTGADGAIIFWDLSTTRNVDVFTNVADAELRALVVTEDSIIAGGNSPNIQQWQFTPQPRLGAFIGQQTGQISSVAIAPDSDIIVTSDTIEDGAIHIWNLETGDERILDEHTQSVTGLAYSGGDLISVAGDGQLIAWDQDGNAQILSDSGGLPIFSIAAHDTLIAIGRSNLAGTTNRIDIWERRNETWELMTTLEGLTSRTMSLDFNPDATLLATANRDNSITVWEIATGEARFTSTGHTGIATSVSFSPDGRVLASASRDQTIILWDVANGEQLGTPLVGHQNWVTQVRFNPVAPMIATSSADGSIRLWDTRTLLPLGEPIIDHDEWVENITWSADGRQLVSVDRSGKIGLWQLSLETLTQQACTLAGRDLQDAEKQRYFNTTDVEPSCGSDE